MELATSRNTNVQYAQLLREQVQCPTDCTSGKCNILPRSCVSYAFAFQRSNLLPTVELHEIQSLSDSEMESRNNFGGVSSFGS